MLKLYAIGREYGWVRVTSSEDLASGTAEIALMDSPVSQPTSDDWRAAVIQPVDNNPDKWDIGLLIGVGAEPIVSGTDYQMWLRINIGDELIVRKTGIVEAL